jgi:two-component sensor histidine kinase
MFHLIFPEDRELAEKEYLALWNNEKNTQHFQIRIVAKSGELKWLDLSGVKIEWEGYPAIMTFVSDITEAKIANDQIKRSLREKEILIKEIHHRVKNNLQIVNSLINLQLRNVSDATARELLNYTRNRVKAISIVHEKVYQSERLDEINARDYISSLMRNLHSVVEQKNVTIETVVKVDDVILPLDSAVPCALIINELVTNAYKYAFVNANHGKLELTFSKKDDNYYLSVWDDGIGFDESFDIHSSDSFGMTIITSQVGQLKGNYSISNKNGAFFEITFPYKPKREYL